MQLGGSGGSGPLRRSAVLVPVPAGSAAGLRSDSAGDGTLVKLAARAHASHPVAALHSKTHTARASAGSPSFGKEPVTKVAFSRANPVTLCATDTN